MPTRAVYQRSHASQAPTPSVIVMRENGCQHKSAEAFDVTFVTRERRIEVFSGFEHL
jgi:hypothetical protein